MNFVQNSKHRRLRNRIRNIADRLSFNFLHLRGSQKIVAVGLAASAFAVFMNWFYIGKSLSEATHSGTAFSSYLGNVGFVKLAFLAGIFVMVFSNRTKSEIKSRSGLAMSDYAFVFFASACLAGLDFSTLGVIRGFTHFETDVRYGGGPSLSIVGDLFAFAGGFLAYREHKRELYETTFVENSRTTSDMLEEYDAIIGKDSPDRKNMSLPV